MAYSVVRVKVNNDDEAYAAGDVFFVNTEFSLPARSAKLVGGYIQDTERKLESADLNIYFFAKNEADLGTINATANISDANFQANQCQGVIRLEGTQNEATNVDNLSFLALTEVTQTSDPTSAGISVILHSQGPTSDGVSYPMYVGGIITQGTPNYTAKKGVIELILHFEH